RRTVPSAGPSADWIHHVRLDLLEDETPAVERSDAAVCLRPATDGVGPPRAGPTRTESRMLGARPGDDDRLPEVRLREPSDERILHELRRVIEIVTSRTKGILPKRSFHPRETMTAVSQLRM